MAPPRTAHVHRAELRLPPGTDARAPGGAVTVALCGSWEHEGPCRWPHHTAIDLDGDIGVVRTVFAAPAHEEAGVRAHIDAALRGGAWAVLASGPDDVAPGERELAGRLVASPPAPGA